MRWHTLPSLQQINKGSLHFKRLLRSPATHCVVSRCPLHLLTQTHSCKRVRSHADRITHAQSHPPLNQTWLVDVSLRWGTSSNGPGLISCLSWSSPVLPKTPQEPDKIEREKEWGKELDKLPPAEMDKQNSFPPFYVFFKSTLSRYGQGIIGAALDNYSSPQSYQCLPWWFTISEIQPVFYWTLGVSI